MKFHLDRTATMSNLEGLSNCGSVLADLEDLKNRQSTAFENFQKEKQAECLAAVVKKKDKEVEVRTLKESIVNLQNQKQKLMEQLTSVKAKGEKAMKSAKAEVASAERAFSKSQDKLSTKIEARDKFKKKLDKFSIYLRDVERDEKLLTSWLSTHSLNIHPHQQETMIEMYNINPAQPGQKFHVMLSSVTTAHSGHLHVTKVFPEFEEAHAVVQQANETKDLLTLLRECRKYWQRDCTDCSPNKSRGSTVSGGDAETSVELFDSPPVSDSKK